MNSRTLSSSLLSSLQLAKSNTPKGSTTASSSSITAAPTSSSTTPPSSSSQPTAAAAAASQSNVTSVSNVSNTTAQAAPINLKISLNMELLPQEKLYPTPSMLDNLPFDVEFDLRLTGCELIQTSGRLLKLPQVCAFLLCAARLKYLKLV